MVGTSIPLDAREKPKIIVYPGIQVGLREGGDTMWQ